jgi:hypothetical protein
MQTSGKSSANIRRLIEMRATRGSSAPLPSMAFEPLSLLFLKFRGRSAAVFRALCSDYDVSCLRRQSPLAFPA